MIGRAFRSPIFARCCGLLLGAVFIAAALSKIVDPTKTQAALAWVLPTRPALVGDLFRVLILFELVLGSVLLVGVARRFASALAAITLAAFSAWIVYLIVADVSIGCGCGIDPGWLRVGSDERVNALLRNGALLLIAAVSMFLAHRNTPESLGKTDRALSGCNQPITERTVPQ